MKKQLLLLVLLVCAHQYKLFSQAGNYTFQSSTETYAEITGTLSDATGDDDISSPVNIGFNFNYCGNYYSQVIISTNGWLSPGTTVSSSNSYNTLSSTYYLPFIAPLWDDLYCSDIRYSSSGTTPNRVFTVQWKNAKWSYYGTAGQNFQVKLFESTNQIKIIYGQMISPSSGYASIGMNSSPGGSDNFISVTPGIAPTMSTSTANDNISSNTYLTNGLTYTFSPLVCNDYSLPFSESFETGEQPPCWKDTVLVNMGSYSPPNWSRLVYFYNCYPIDGNFLETFNSGSIYSGSEARLSTPALNFSGISNPEIKFFMYHNSSTYYSQEGLQIQGSANGSTWTNIGSFIQNGSVQSGWKEHVISLSQFGNQPVVYIAFNGHSEYGYDMYIDRVKISQQNNIGIAGTPTGITSHCQGSGTNIFTTTGASNATSYQWTIYPASSGIISGTGITATVTWDASFSGTSQIFVKGINGSDEGPVSNSINVSTINNHFASYSYISPSDANICPNTAISFYASASGTVTNYQWNFGDGTNSTQSYPSHSYSGIGDYNVTVHITNSCADTTLMSTVHVGNDIHFSGNIYMDISPQTVCPNSNVSFYTYSSNVASFLWNFGDGTTANTYGPYHQYSDTGTYIVSLKLTNYCNNDTTVYDTVFVKNNLHFSDQIYIYISPNPVCPDGNVYFSPPQGQTVTSYLWTFGDGGTSTEDYVSHSYALAGNYPVSLQLTNTCGIDTIIQDIVHVDQNLHFSGTVYLYYNQTVCPNESVSFSSQFSSSQSIVGYLWNFGDGTTSTEDYSHHTYSESGNYQISVKFTNQCGFDTTIYGLINVITNLHFSGNIQLYIVPPIVCPGDQVRFEVNRSAASYLWNFGNGLTSNHNYTNQDIFTIPGTYQISMTLTNGCGIDTTVYDQLEVRNDLHITDGEIEFSPDSLMCPGSTVWFEAYPYGYSYLWNFGVGSTSTEQSPSHQFPNLGNYNVSVKMTNGCNFDTTLYQTIHIQSNAPADPDDYDFSILYDTVCINDTAMFYFDYPDEGTYLINFGDGFSSTVATPFYFYNQYLLDFFKHKYSSVGNYTVTITLTTFCGDVITKSTEVIVSNQTQAEAELDYYSQNLCKNQPISFLGLGGSHYSWNFGDGSPTVIQNAGISTVTHTYTNAGTYIFSLTVSNSCGDSDSETYQINIDNCSSTLSVNAGSDEFINCGSSANLNAMVYYPGTGTVTYSWSPSAGLSATNIANPVASPTTNTTYTVLVTAPNGETVSDQVLVTVTPLSVTAGSDVTINCTSGTSLNAVASSSGATFNWTPASGLSATNIANPVASPLHTIAYTITATLGSCTATDEVVVSVTSPNYGTDFSVNQATFLTPPFDVQFTNLTPSMSDYSFIWFFGDETFQSSNNSLVNHNYQYNGSYSVKLITTASNGCTDSLVKTNYINCSGGITGPPDADFTGVPTIINVFGSVNFSDSSTNNPVSWKWSFPGAFPNSSTLQNPVGITYYNVGTYNVKLVVTNSTGSDSITKVNYITVNPTGIDGYSLSDNLLVTPNPNKGTFNIEYIVKSRTQIDIKILNYLGQIIYNQSNIQVLEKYSETIDINVAAAGIYFLHIETTDKVIVKKIIKE